MIAIFTSPRPFLGEFNRIQCNAILSWLALKEVKIYIFDDEEKTSKKICKQYGVEYIADVQKNKYGTPLMGDCLEKIRKKSRASIVAHVSTDIILTHDFVDTIKKVDELFVSRSYYMVGQRIDICDQLDLADSPLDKFNVQNLKKKGQLHSPTAMDYFIFPDQFKIKMPSFVIGRPGWDSWLIAYCKKNKIPVVDASNAITAFHQQHSYPSKKLSFFAKECDYNFQLAGGDANLMNIRESDLVYCHLIKGLKRPTGVRFVLSFFSRYKFYGYCLIFYRKLKKFILNIKK